MSSKTINEIVTGFRQKFIKDIEQVEALFVLQEAVITALLNKQNEQQ